MATIAVSCDGGPADGWTCRVAIRDGDRDVSTHQVSVRTSDLRRLAPGASEPTALVKQSFSFLLERESPQMILRSFDLLDIARYFPDFESEIHRRVRIA
ncbi:MAG TPA: hypothetical protein VGJ71_03820 [Candidatus Limnocylindrales bacterium]|jgi:hypothetical protein